MWLKQLKIAIVEKNTDNINKLMDDIPQLEDIDEINQAIYLLREASELVHTLKDDVSKSMIQMKKNIDFLKSTQSKKKSTLDIKL
ncbi:hypothetical protein [Sulfurimonas sp.]